MPNEQPEILSGGNASGDVVLVAGTVRKPWLPTTDRMIAFMAAIRSTGIDVPRTHGRDEAGRLSLEFIPGHMAIDHGPLPIAVVRRVGALVRSIHDASAHLPVADDWDVLLPAPGEPELICHNDLATWNLVIDADRLVFIDWDGAGPSTRIWDLAYAAIAFAHLFPGADVGGSAERLAAFASGYGASGTQRAALPGVMIDRAQAMLDLLRDAHESGRQPWGDMFLDGHGDHWAGTVDFIRKHEREWATVLHSATVSEE